MESENQALRAVSALIYAKCQLHEYIHRKLSPGIDD